MRRDIKVSFKGNPEEIKLYNDIIARCEFIGKSTWIKIAAREKLERDGNKLENNKPQKINMANNNSSGIINSLDDLFSK